MDYRTSVLDNFKIDEFIFCSNFDSGNLGKVEVVQNETVKNFGDIVINKEFNTWTTPDCFGTPRQSPNRTWFFFSVRGGRPFQNVRINVNNLNRQSKLFSQGMHPVMRYGNSGKWERVRDRPLYQTEDGVFSISLCHHVPEKPDVDVFYAFTFPFTYTETQTMLDKFDEKYFKSEENLKSILNHLCMPKAKPGNDGDIINENDVLNDVYYKRELLINSLEGRRVDLLTITSFHGILNKREDFVRNLFPEFQHHQLTFNDRCHRFENKKIIFLSSRVHPGETPASFILNGFLNILLDKKNPTAITLRQLYVFKIVPIINPDGVYRGFYRTDTLGQNLNRWYTNPTLQSHPTIYAIKKIIYYFSTGQDLDDLTNSNQDQLQTIESELDNGSLSSGSSEEDKPSIEEPTTSTTGAIIDESCQNNNNDSNSLLSEVTSDESENSGNNSSHKKYLKETQPDSIPIAVPVHLTAKKSHEKAVNKSIKKRITTSAINNSATFGVAAGIKKFSPPAVPRRYLFETNLDVTYEFIQKNSLTPTNGLYKIFLYIDFHGHASKKGIFMYGNHFSNVSEAVECKLLPKLMSLNSQHFHFDACNFSEKNMYRKEKRDGLSKEGSGRVDIFKMTGLIKSFTLEGNYNTGRYINILPPVGQNAAKKHSTVAAPPKYTPAIFEEIGRALGSSILDLTNSNSSSRLQNSEYRTLQGLRISLRNDIERLNNPHRNPFGRMRRRKRLRRRKRKLFFGKIF